MGNNPALRRRPLRLPHYDYSQPGAYFLTIVTRGREPMLGDVEDGRFRPTGAGTIVGDEWHALSIRFSSVILDAFVIMPNHVHAILILIDSERGAASSAPTLGKIVRAFKSTSARRANRMLGRSGKVWQRSYFERITRSDRELDAIRRYIEENPIRWNDDPENPRNRVR